MVVDGLDGSIEVAQSVADKNAVFEGFDVQGSRSVGIAGGNDLPYLGGVHTDLCGKFGNGGVAPQVLGQEGLRPVER